MMTNEQIQFTKEWWAAVCKNPEKFERWIQKLQLTEIEGGQGHDQFLLFAGLVARIEIPKRAITILNNISADEKKHSDLLLNLMHSRGITPIVFPQDCHRSSYWDYMNDNMEFNLAEYSAVNFYGEGLASERFEIILDHPDTAADVKETIRLILPDEIFHRETLGRLAGEEALAKIKPHHDFAFGRLITK